MQINAPTPMPPVDILIGTPAAQAMRPVHDGWDEAGAGRAARDDPEGDRTGCLGDLRDLLEGA